MESMKYKPVPRPFSHCSRCGPVWGSGRPGCCWAWDLGGQCPLSHAGRWVHWWSSKCVDKCTTTVNCIAWPHFTCNWLFKFQVVVSTLGWEISAKFVVEFIPWKYGQNNCDNWINGWECERVGVWGWGCERVGVWEGGGVRGWGCERVGMERLGVWVAGSVSGWECERLGVRGWECERLGMWEAGSVRLGVRGWECERLGMWEGGSVRGWDVRGWECERLGMWEGGSARGLGCERVGVWEGGECERVGMWEVGSVSGWECERLGVWRVGCERLGVWEGGSGVRGWGCERLGVWEAGSERVGVWEAGSVSGWGCEMLGAWEGGSVRGWEWGYMFSWSYDSMTHYHALLCQRRLPAAAPGTGMWYKSWCYSQHASDGCAVASFQGPTPGQSSAGWWRPQWTGLCAGAPESSACSAHTACHCSSWSVPWNCHKRCHRSGWRSSQPLLFHLCQPVWRSYSTMREATSFQNCLFTSTLTMWQLHH